MNPSPSMHFFLSFCCFKVEISSSTPIPPLKPGLSTTAQHAEMTVTEHFLMSCVWACFPDSQPTLTLIGRGCMHVQVEPATYTFGRMTAVFYASQQWHWLGRNRRLKRVNTESLLGRWEFSYHFCWDLNLQPFDSESSTCMTSWAILIPRQRAEQ